MLISDILTVDNVYCAKECSSKKNALEFISSELGQSFGCVSQEIFDSLITRERLGSTGLGKGIAIPHGRMKHSEETFACFLQLDEAIDFDAMDSKPVDLIFALLVPEESTQEHLQILGQLAELFANDDFSKKLRTSNKPEEIHQLLTSKPNG